jgi:PadR family transcriptional regulator, regulatory protein PadR
MGVIDPQMLKGLVGMLLLDALEHEDKYGYALVSGLRAAGFDDLSESTVYPALARCEQAGWIASYLVPSAKGPARKYYRITPAGRTERVRAHGSWNRLTQLIADLTEGKSS